MNRNIIEKLIIDMVEDFDYDDTHKVFIYMTRELKIYSAFKENATGVAINLSTLSNDEITLLEKYVGVIYDKKKSDAAELIAEYEQRVEDMNLDRILDTIS